MDEPDEITGRIGCSLLQAFSALDGYQALKIQLTGAQAGKCVLDVDVIAPVNVNLQ